MLLLFEFVLRVRFFCRRFLVDSTGCGFGRSSSRKSKCRAWLLRRRRRSHHGARRGCSTHGTSWKGCFVVRRVFWDTRAFLHTKSNFSSAGRVTMRTMTPRLCSLPVASWLCMAAAAPTTTTTAARVMAHRPFALLGIVQR